MPKMARAGRLICACRSRSLIQLRIQAVINRHERTNLVPPHPSAPGFGPPLMSDLNRLCSCKLQETVCQAEHPTTDLTILTAHHSFLNLASVSSLHITFKISGQKSEFQDRSQKLSSSSAVRGFSPDLIQALLKFRKLTRQVPDVDSIAVAPGVQLAIHRARQPEAKVSLI